MDLRKRLFCLAVSGIFSFMAFSNTFQIDSEAAVTDFVQLTPQQTLALYGDTVSAQYYTTHNSWSDCTFRFLGFSSGLVSTGNNLSAGGYAGTTLSTLFSGTWLWYGVNVTTLTDAYDNNSQFQFRFVPSVSVEGVAYFRQIIGSVRYSTHGSGYDPWRSSYYAACSTSYSPSYVVFNGRGLDMSTTDSAANVYFTPAPPTGTELSFDPQECAFCDLYLQNLDDNGLEQTFSYNGLVFRPTRSPSVDVSELYQGTTATLSYYLICMSCPWVTDGYILPNVPTTAPDYSGQLDDIISQGAANQTILQQILAKLNLIYAEMQNTSNEVSIVSSSVNAIVNGTKNLFIPTQTDLVNFRLSLMQELQSAFPAFYTAESSIHDAFDIFDDVEPVSSVRFPGVSVGFPSGSGTGTAVFSLPAQDVELKPESNRLQPLYDALAWIIDIICTLAVFNMVKHKFHKIFEGSAAD